MNVTERGLERGGRKENYCPSGRGMWRISNVRRKEEPSRKWERTKRGFVDLRLRKGNTSLIFSDRPTSLTKTGNHRCHYWFFFILLFSFLGRIESSILAILAKVFLFSHYRYLSFHIVIVHILRRIVSKCLFNSRNSNKRAEFVKFFFLPILWFYRCTKSKLKINSLSSKIEKVNSQKNLKFKDSKILRNSKYLII